MAGLIKRPISSAKSDLIDALRMLDAPTAIIDKFVRSNDPAQVWDDVKQLLEYGGTQAVARPTAVVDALQEYIDVQGYNRGDLGRIATKSYVDYLMKFRSFIQKDDERRGIVTMTHAIPMETVLNFLREKRKPDRRGKGDGRVSNATWNWRLAVLGPFFLWCVRKNYMLYGQNPRTNLEMKSKLPENNIRPRILSVSEIGRFLRLSSQTRYSHRNRMLCETFLSTGARLSEALSLTEDALDFRHNQIHIFNGKGSKSRSIPMLTSYRIALLEYLEVLKWQRSHLPVQPEHKKHLFYSMEGKTQGRPLKSRAVQDMVQRVLVKMKLPYTPDLARVTVHKLRHTFAVNVIRSAHSRNGVEIDTLMKLLGHENYRTTKIYLQALEEPRIRKEMDLALGASGLRRRRSTRWDNVIDIVNRDERMAVRD